MVKRLERRWLNLAHWSNDYARHKNYEIYKNFFVYFAALHYGETGHYPKSRADVAEVMPDQQLAQNVLLVTNDYRQCQQRPTKPRIRICHTNHPKNVVVKN
ncbi:MAG: hypothetical protein R3B12_01515 [Candidatus Saccharimonadales bacterium]